MYGSVACFCCVRRSCCCRLRLLLCHFLELCVTGLEVGIGRSGGRMVLNIGNVVAWNVLMYAMLLQPF